MHHEKELGSHEKPARDSSLKILWLPELKDFQMHYSQFQGKFPVEHANFKIKKWEVPEKNM